MNISILSVFPELYSSFLATSLPAKAAQKGLVKYETAGFMDYVAPKERIDVPTCGPSAGMILSPTVVEHAVTNLEARHGSAYKIFFSPQGKKLDQTLLHQIYQKIEAQGCKHIMLVAGRYEGMDARVEEEYADEIISIGDYVLMGGDLPAMVFIEGFLRLIPGVIGNAESVVNDSFTGPFVDYPEYGLPVNWRGREVPEIVRSGNHQAIMQWRRQQAVQKTVLYHFEWLKNYPVTQEQKKLASTSMPHHYVALLHTDVLVGAEKVVGTTSVTSIDVHDIARSARTYGLKKFFVITPLLDQQKMVGQFLGFWQEGHGISYNPNRHEAVRQVEIMASLQETIDAITQKEGVAPLVIATSAQAAHHEKSITYHDQSKVWMHKRPILFILGTGQGIAPDVVQMADYVLLPVHGFTDYNHLSVRSAAAIIFDRWLGIVEKNESKLA